jgi:hypothetical protein
MMGRGTTGMAVIAMGMGIISTGVVVVMTESPMSNLGDNAND